MRANFQLLVEIRTLRTVPARTEKEHVIKKTEKGSFCGAIETEATLLPLTALKEVYALNKPMYVPREISKC